MHPRFVQGTSELDICATFLSEWGYSTGSCYCSVCVWKSLVSYIEDVPWPSPRTPVVIVTNIFIHQETAGEVFRVQGETCIGKLTLRNKVRAVPVADASIIVYISELHILVYSFCITYFGSDSV